MKLKEVFSFPVLQPPDEENEKWHWFKGEKVGQVLPDGSIEGTPYKFRRGISGGVAITTHQRVAKRSEEELYNPATGDSFKKTKKGTGFFNKKKKIFLRAYYERDFEDGK